MIDENFDLKSLRILFLSKTISFSLVLSKESHPKRKRIKKKVSLNKFIV
jgi:hypothetical protein